MNVMQRSVFAVHMPAGALIAAALFALIAAQDVAAQKWPDKTVRIVTPFAPGGGTDIYARLLAQRFSEVLGSQFIVENRPGAGSTTGTEFVARAAPDGHTLLMASSSFTFNPGLYPKLRYDSLKDFTGISQAVKVPHVILVLPSFPAKTLQDLVRIARAKPGEVLYASSGPGSAMHLAGALFALQTKAQFTHIPYKGGPAAATAVMSGEATVSFSTIETVISLIQAKRLRVLAVSTRERSPALPDVPTAMEAGFKDYEAIGWFGLLAPAGTPGAVIDTLSGEIARLMATPAMRERVAQDGATAVGNKPAEFDRFLRSEIAKWTPIIQQAGIKID
jgi:tripartite-type tricarboxylate transporter receptor subunit TctC